MTKSNNNPIQRGYNPNSCWPILIVFSLLPYFVNFKNAMPARATKAAPTTWNILSPPEMNITIIPITKSAGGPITRASIFTISSTPIY